MSKMDAGGLTFKQKYGFLSVVAMIMALSGLPSSSLAFCSLLILIWLFLGGHRTIYLAYHTLGRDLRAVRFVFQLILLVKWAEWRNWTVPKMFSETVKATPNKVMFYFEDQKWTFKQVEEYSNRVAHFFISKGLTRGDSVAVFMENRPEYVAIWLGLAKVGLVPALINYNLKLQALVHTIKVANAKAIIYGAELQDSINEVISSVQNGCSTVFPTFCSGLAGATCSVPGSVDLDAGLESMSCSEVDKKIQDSIGFKDKLLYIYTSGTTGLPKAAVIKHSRFILASSVSIYLAGLKPSDTLYNPLPLYHSSAGMLAIGPATLFGVTVALRKKFSATQFWKDCVRYNATAAQYIGEICRYLLNTPECPEERQHKVRLMFGNGLRPQIWEKFVQRFQVPQIAEFYGSTEGNSNIINYENVVGAVGFVSVLFPTLLPLGLIKVDRETGKEIRDANGLCVRCGPGEPGEFVGLIQRNHPVRDFDGYAADSNATRSKIVSDVWKKGDMCFRSGDILVSDEFGWLYFKDRAGDTFRWRGENVSTTEVEAVVSNMVQLKDAVVYGVEIPGTEGRAGMAAIHDPQEEVDMSELARAIQIELPSFSRPLFVRVVKHLDITGTFKLRKFNLQREGFDPRTITDKLFFLHPKTNTYETLSLELFNSIVTGAIRL